MKLKDKDKLIQLFIKWLKLKNQNFKFDIDENNVNSILKYFQFIATLLIKYQICQSSNLLPSINLSIQTILDDFNFSKSQLSKLLQ